MVCMKLSDVDFRFTYATHGRSARVRYAKPDSSAWTCCRRNKSNTYLQERGRERGREREMTDALCRVY